jgi:hypothetical protein
MSSYLPLYAFLRFSDFSAENLVRNGHLRVEETDMSIFIVKTVAEMNFLVVCFTALSVSGLIALFDE